jgi:UDP-3-O-[3-hydroxymyristoyl] glucosamine N-acyltransferase
VSLFFIHPTSICETNDIGQGTKIWAFTHVLKGAIIGSDCNICDFVFIENNVVIGNEVTIKSGVYLWNGVSIEDNNVRTTDAEYRKQIDKTIKHLCSLNLDRIQNFGIITGSNEDRIRQIQSYLNL